MSARLALPAPSAVARVLRDLFGKAVGPKKGAPMPASVQACTGTYVDDSGAVVAVCICDLALSASMGAALALIPVTVAADAASKGSFPDEIFDNLREVLNILAGIFEGTHVRLRDSSPPSTALPPAVGNVLIQPRMRLDLELTLAGYAGGRLSLLLA